MRALSFVSTLVPFALSAQTTFAPIGAEWSYLQHYLDGSTVLFTVHCAGDTLIGADTCSVLTYSGGVSECVGFSPIIRTSGDTVYWQDPANEAFQVLYVFGLPVGQGWSTLVGYWSDDGGGPVVLYDTLTFMVTASDEVLVDGLTLRRSTVEASSSTAMQPYHYPFSGYVTERLGHSGFMFPWVYVPCDMEGNNPLNCYSDAEIDWMAPDILQCDQGVGIAERTRSSGIEVQPTLAGAGDPITIRTTDVPAADIEVVDPSGRTVQRTRATAGGTTVRIDHQGLYTVVVGEGRTRAMARVLVHD